MERVTFCRLSTEWWTAFNLVENSLYEIAVTSAPVSILNLNVIPSTTKDPHVSYAIYSCKYVCGNTILDTAILYLNHSGLGTVYEFSTIPTFIIFALQSFLLCFGNLPHLGYLSHLCCSEGKLVWSNSLQVFQILSVCVYLSYSTLKFRLLRLNTVLLLFRIAVLCMHSNTGPDVSVCHPCNLFI